MFKIIIAVLAITVVMLIALAGVDAMTTDIVEPNDSNSYVVEGETNIQATISGEVARPGTYLLEEGATLSDLIASAGGTNGNADSRAYDISFVVETKMSFYIAPLFDIGDVCATEPIPKVNINAATKSELDEGVSAFSSSVAEAIVSYRNDNGLFRRIEELKDVKGIGTATFEKCKDFVTLRD